MERSRAKLEEHSEHHGRLKNYINGGWEDSESSQIREVINPATGKVIIITIQSIDLAEKDGKAFGKKLCENHL